MTTRSHTTLNPTPATPHAAAPRYEPWLWLGSPSPGALRLPDAKASDHAMYGPRGVLLHEHALIVADSGNHRILIWSNLPTQDHQPADIVLGQPSMTSEAPSLLHLPTGIAAHRGRLLVCDAWHHRVLIWNRIPHSSDTPPDAVLGQASLLHTTENRGRPPAPNSMYWPYGLHISNDRLYVADTGNRRVLVWNHVPENDTPADAVIGQHHLHCGEENRGEGVGPRSFRWPHAVTEVDGGLAVADAGNHRVLVWKSSRDATNDHPADAIIGQPDFTTAREWPYGPQSPHALRFPYFLAADNHFLHVADTANNRVLHFAHADLWSQRPAALTVTGQPDLQASGENQWAAVRRDTLCWPYGLAAHDGILAVADSGNNRVMLWRRADDAASPHA